MAVPRPAAHQPPAPHLSRRLLRPRAREGPGPGPGLRRAPVHAASHGHRPVGGPGAPGRARGRARPRAAPLVRLPPPDGPGGRGAAARAVHPAQSPAASRLASAVGLPGAGAARPRLPPGAPHLPAARAGRRAVGRAGAARRPVTPPGARSAPALPWRSPCPATSTSVS
ncbi:hypothetical protein LZ198_35090 [Myxococcus sp. K15C18031901]|nr:hypothetical protein [Myxococcus dinghuensis]